MQKFKQQQNRSRFDKYIINTPVKAKQNGRIVSEQTAHTRGLSITNPSTEQENKIELSTLNEINSKLSIRSSKGRSGSGRLNRREAINRQMTKTTIRRMKRFNTEQADPDPAHDQRIASLKRCVNHLNATCNQLKINDAVPTNSRLENYAREARKKFMMGQLCFTEIDEDRIEQQKKYLTTFGHLNQSLSKMLNTESASVQADKANESLLLSCLRGIDRIFVVLRQMEFAGYPSRSNKFMIDYCICGRMWLKRVFLAQDSRKDPFTMAVKYCVTALAEEAKGSFSALLASAGTSQPLAGYLRDIQGLYQHLQSSLTEKKLFKLMNVPQAGERMVSLLSAGHGSEGKLRLTEDLEQVQSQFGPMREITKISRRKFEELNRTYNRLQGLA